MNKAPIFLRPRTGALFAAAFFIAVLARGEAQSLTISNDVQTYAALTNTAVTLAGASQLRITGATSPISGCTINLVSPDAWLFLTGIRPSTVNSVYRSQIQVNGAAAVADSNCRIVQYGDGTVVIPHSASYTPLQIFTGPMYSGSSLSLASYTTYATANLGTLADNIGSFKLKRGYAVTFAQNSDGTGVSKNYVAADGDLEVGAMPADLGNGVSFVRVFPWRWTSKKGVAGNITSGLNVRWWYSWSIDQNSTLDTEYVPIRQSRYWPSLSQDWKSRGSSQLLGYNEPDRPDQSNMSVSAAISSWRDLLGTGMRVGAPAVSDGGRDSWLYPFIDQANSAKLRVDFVPVHRYVCYAPSDAAGAAAAMYSSLKALHDRVKRPIWVTEWNNGASWTGCGDPTYDQQKAAVAAMIKMMEETPWIERYAIYNWVEDCRRVKWDDGSLTKAGVAYRDQVSNIGYRQVVPSVPTTVRAHYRFEGDARDNSGRSHNAILHGAAKFGAGYSGKAVSLSGDSSSQDYVELSPRLAQTGDFTFAAWVYWNGGANWQRIFDLGDDTDAYMYLTPKSSSGTMSFGIYNGSTKQTIDAPTAMPANTWTHVAVTISGSTGKLFLNGVPVATNASMTINPSDLGATTCYLGKSQWPSDPLFSGMIDDAYFFSYAPGDAVIAQLMTNTPPQFGSRAITGAAGLQGQPYTGTVAGTATDADAGDTIVYFKGTGPSWLSVATDGTVTGTPPSNLDGPQVCVVYAVDSAGASDYAIFTLPLPYVTGNGTWTADSGGLWSDTAKWSSNFPAKGAGFTADFSTIDISADTAVVLDGARPIGGLLFGDTSGTQAWRVESLDDSKLTLQTVATSPAISVNQNAATIAVPLAGTNGFTKNGAGTLVLLAANSLAGTVTLNAGSVAVGNEAAFGSGTVDLRGAALIGADGEERRIENALTLSASTVFGAAGGGNLYFSGPVNAGSLAKTFNVANAQTEFSGTISGSGPLTKSGAGSLVLSGTNSATGTLSVTAGTLAVAGSIANTNVSCAAGAVLAGGGTISGAASISGTHRPGAGVGSQPFAAGLTYGSTARVAWELAGNTVSAGAFDTVSAKTLAVSGGAGINVVLDSAGSTVDFTDRFWIYGHKWPVLSSGAGISGTFGIGTVSPDSAGRAASSYGTFSVQQAFTNIYVVFTPAAPVPLPERVAGVAPVAGNNQVALAWAESAGADSYTVYRATSAGGPYAAIASGLAATSFKDVSATNGAVYYYVISPINSSGAGASSAEIAVAPHVPGTISKADNIVDLNLAGSWSGAMLPASGDVVRWSGLVGANSVQLGSDIEVKGIVVGATGGKIIIGGTNTITLGVGGADLSAADQDLAITASVNLGMGHRAWSVPLGRALSLETGEFARRVGATLNILGAGTVTADMPGLANDGSTGSGLIRWATIGAGTATSFVARRDDGTLGAYTNATVTANFGWTANTGNGDDIVNYEVAGTTGNIGIPRTANTVRYTGGAATQYYGSKDTVLLPLNALLNAGSGVLTIAQSAGLSGFVAGTGEGEGELLLVAANAGITISAPIYDSRTTTSGATNDIALGGFPSAVTTAGPGTITLSGTNAFTGGVNVASGTLAANSAGALGPNTSPLFVSEGASLNLGAGLNLGGAVTGAGTISQNGAANVTLSGNFAGFTGTYVQNITNNNTQVSSPAATGKLAAYHLAVAHGSSGGLLLMGAGTYELGSLSGVTGSTLRNSSSVSGATLLQIGALDRNSTFAGNIGGGGGTMALTKVGLGTLVLGGSNSYTGVTSVNAGTLRVNGTLSATNGTVAVASGAVFGGSGSVAGTLGIFAGGTLAPGNAGAGALIVTGPLMLGSGSAIDVTVGGSNRVAYGGPLFCSGTTTVNVFTSGAFVPGTYPVLTGTSAITTANFALGATPAGYVSSLIASNGTLSVNVITPNQAWRQSHFGASAGNETVAGNAADPDGDSKPNLIEYAVGTDPMKAEPGPPLAAGPSREKLTILFNRRPASDVTLTVQGADAAGGPWTDLVRSAGGAPFSVLLDGAAVTETDAGGARSVEAADAYPMGDAAHPSRFMRLRATQQ